jgi:hypothetical protein
MQKNKYFFFSILIVFSIFFSAFAFADSYVCSGNFGGGSSCDGIYDMDYGTWSTTPDYDEGVLDAIYDVPENVTLSSSYLQITLLADYIDLFSFNISLDGVCDVGGLNITYRIYNAGGYCDGSPKAEIFVDNSACENPNYMLYNLSVSQGDYCSSGLGIRIYDARIFWYIPQSEPTGYSYQYTKDDFAKIIFDGMGTAGTTFVSWINLIVMLLFVLFAFIFISKYKK